MHHISTSLLLILSTDVTGGSAGIGGAPLIHHSPGRPRGSSVGDGSAMENGVTSRSGARARALMSDHWEQAYSDTGESYYVE